MPTVSISHPHLKCPYIRHGTIRPLVIIIQFRTRFAIIFIKATGIQQKHIQTVIPQLWLPKIPFAVNQMFCPLCVQS